MTGLTKVWRLNPFKGIDEGVLETVVRVHGGEFFATEREAWEAEARRHEQEAARSEASALASREKAEAARARMPAHDAKVPKVPAGVVAGSARSGSRSRSGPLPAGSARRRTASGGSRARTARSRPDARSSPGMRR